MTKVIGVRRRKDENIGSFLFRFNKKIKQSGVLREVKKRRFQHRSINRSKRRHAALYRLHKQEELAHIKKYGA